MNQDLEAQVRSLAAGVKVVALAFVLMISYLNIRCALQIDAFAAIFDDMLANKPLPLLAAGVIKGQMVLLVLAFLLPAAAIAATLAIRNHKAALFTLAGLMLVAFLQMHVTWSALFSTLMSIITRMMSFTG